MTQTQSGITIIAQLRGGVSHASERLAELGQQVDEHQRADVEGLRAKERIHFLGFFAFETQQDPPAAFVVLEVSGDGSPRQLCKLLAQCAPGFMGEVFRDCFDTDDAQRSCSWYDFLREHDAGSGAFYLANPGRSVKQVIREAALRKAASDQLRDPPRDVTAAALWTRIQAQLKPDPRASGPKLLPFWMRWGFHPKGAQRQLRALRQWSVRALQVALYLLGLNLADDLFQRSSPALAVAPPLAALAVMLPVWLRERPVHAKARVWWVFTWAWLRTSAFLFVILGFVALVPRVVGFPLETLQPYAKPALAMYAAVAGVATLAVVGVFAGVAVGRIFAAAFSLISLAAWAFAIRACWVQPSVLVGIWLAGTAVATLFIAGFTAVLAKLTRSAELTDTEPAIAFDLDRLQRNTAREDRALHNHLATVTELRAGRVRLYALRVVLRAIALLARVRFNQGDLDRIVSIHYARFVIHSHQGTHRLLFMGNYDGGFSAYLGAFSTVIGTTAVWSNTQGFPRTFGLLWDGANDEQRFKAFGRKSQVQTLGWFSAYPDLSTRDVAAGSATHLALNRVPAKPIARPWLELWHAVKSGRAAVIAAEIQGRFDEAACDAAVRRL